MDHSGSSSSLCLTTARVITCESSGPSTTSPRIGTRSSRMPQDESGNPNEVSPVNKIRGLVKTLSPRKRKTTTAEDGPTTQMNSDTAEPQKSPAPKLSLMKSLKRKRTPSISNITIFPKKVKNGNEGPSVNPNTKLSPNISRIFPVLKLTRTAGTTNNYVAFLSEKNRNLGNEPGIKSNDQSPENSQTESCPSHKHNTRLRRKKHTGEKSEVSSKTTGFQEQNAENISVPNGEALVEVYTQQPGTAMDLNTLEENTKRKHLNRNVNQAYAKRGVQPRNHNQELRVGEVIWGKVHGHPWWPGRILGILCHSTENDAGFVKVAWYGSTTTSDISCSFLMTFQENFKQLFKKQKQGAYRRAVREAQQDLQVMDEQIKQVHEQVSQP